MPVSVASRNFLENFMHHHSAGHGAKMTQFKPHGENRASLADGYVAGGTAFSVARRNFPKRFLLYHRAGLGVTMSSQTQCGYTPFVHNEISRAIGASGINVDTMSFGKTEGDTPDKKNAHMLQDDEADGPYYRMKGEGMPLNTPFTSGGVKALRSSVIYKKLGQSKAEGKRRR